MVYLAALVLALFASFASCRFSMVELVRWIQYFPVGILCTFQNFLHGTALLPQLVVSRQRGFVAPAAAKFLVIIAVKHIVEFLSDSVVTVQLWQANKLILH